MSVRGPPVEPTIARVQKLVRKRSRREFMSSSPELATNQLTVDAAGGQRRCVIKWFVAIVTAVIVFDVYPPEIFAWPELKRRFSQTLSLLGVEQNQWRLFAPDPSCMLGGLKRKSTMVQEPAPLGLAAMANGQQPGEVLSLPRTQLLRSPRKDG